MENLFYAHLDVSGALTGLFSIVFAILLYFNFVSLVMRFLSLEKWHCYFVFVIQFWGSVTNIIKGK